MDMSKLQKKKTVPTRTVKTNDLIEIVMGYFIYPNDSEERQQQGKTKVIATELQSVEQAEGFIQGYVAALEMESFDDIDPDIYPVVTVEYAISVNGTYLTGLEYFFDDFNYDDCDLLNLFKRIDKETMDDIDEIVKYDVDDDPIDMEVLQKEADDLEDDYRELTDEELIEIGVDPNTKEPIEMDFVINQLESLELNSTEMITEDGDCQIWKDDVVALKYAIVLIKWLKANLDKEMEMYEEV